MTTQTTTRPTFAEVYRHATELANGSCPIEAGLLGNLADNECEHENLPGDGKFDPECFCWPRAVEQNSKTAEVIELPRPAATPARKAA